MTHPAERFSGRVESYRQFRPRYPAAVVALLRQECGLREDSVVVDVAAGTGLLAEIFLAGGFSVTAVEPNAEMRTACSQLEGTYPQLRCVAGTAEGTGLAADAADLITVGQAMHWFDPGPTRAEFARVLRPGGWCAVVYNERRMGGDAFHDGYERLLLDYGVDYLKVQRQHMSEERLRAFFAPAEMRRAVFSNEQALTLEGLMGRVVSSSYMPQAGQARYAEMQAALERMFEENAREGVVHMEYDCAVSYGRIGE